MAKTIIMESIKALGLKLKDGMPVISAQARSKWIDEHPEEIAADIQKLGAKKAATKWHIGYSALRKRGFIPQKGEKAEPKPPKAKVKKSTRMLKLEGIRPEIEAFLKDHNWDETCAQFKADFKTLKKLGLRRERVRGGIISSIVTVPVEIEKIIETLPPETDVGYLIAKGLINKIETLEKALTAANAKITKLESQLAEKEEERKKIIAHYSKVLEKAKGIRRTITLNDLKRSAGRGSDGTRRSFQE